MDIKDSFAGLQDVASIPRPALRRRKKFDRRKKDNRKNNDETDELLVFGYACTLVDDPTVAQDIDHGKYLGPCMADESLLVDRHDVRHNVSDLNRFKTIKRKLKDIPLSQRGDEDDRATYKLCDVMRREAYDQALLKKQQAEKEQLEALGTDNNSGNTFHYDYGVSNLDASQIAHSQQPTPAEVARYSGVTAMSILHGECTEAGQKPVSYQLPFTLPKDIRAPMLRGVHEIIVSVVQFLEANSMQAEIALKASIDSNPLISFLSVGHALHRYYQFIRECVRVGRLVGLLEEPDSDGKMEDTDTKTDADTTEGEIASNERSTGLVADEGDADPIRSASAEAGHTTRQGNSAADTTTPMEAADKTTGDGADGMHQLIDNLLEPAADTASLSLDDCLAAVGAKSSGTDASGVGKDCKENTKPVTSKVSALVSYGGYSDSSDNNDSDDNDDKSVGEKASSKAEKSEAGDKIVISSGKGASSLVGYGADSGTDGANNQSSEEEGETQSKSRKPKQQRSTKNRTASEHKSGSSKRPVEEREESPDEESGEDADSENVVNVVFNASNGADDVPAEGADDEGDDESPGEPTTSVTLDIKPMPIASSDISASDGSVVKLSGKRGKVARGGVVLSDCDTKSKDASSHDDGDSSIKFTIKGSASASGDGDKRSHSPGSVARKTAKNREDSVAKGADATHKRKAKSELTADRAGKIHKKKAKSEETAKGSDKTHKRKIESEESANCADKTQKKKAKCEETTKCADQKYEETAKSEETTKGADKTHKKKAKSEKTADNADKTQKRKAKSEETADSADMNKAKSDKTANSEDKIYKKATSEEISDSADETHEHKAKSREIAEEVDKTHKKKATVDRPGAKASKRYYRGKWRRKGK